MRRLDASVELEVLEYLLKEVGHAGGPKVAEYWVDRVVSDLNALNDEEEFKHER